MRMAAGGVVVRARRLQFPSPIWRAFYSSTSRPSNTTAPPQPRPWRKQEPSERVVRPPQWAQEEAQSTQPKKRSWTHRLFALRDDSIPEEQPTPQPQPTPSPPKQQPQQPTDTAARALEASRRYITEGFKDPRYRSAARRVTAIICALPLALYLSYELFQRRFMGKEQKIRPTKPSGEVKPAVEGAEATKDEKIIGD